MFLITFSQNMVFGKFNSRTRRRDYKRASFSSRDIDANFFGARRPLEYRLYLSPSPIPIFTLLSSSVPFHATPFFQLCSLEIS